MSNKSRRNISRRSRSGKIREGQRFSTTDTKQPISVPASMPINPVDKLSSKVNIPTPSIENMDARDLKSEMIMIGITTGIVLVVLIVAALVLR